MDASWTGPNHRKRKRRRGADRPALPAQLVLDGRLQGDVGVLSEDLFDELFPALAQKEPGSHPAVADQVYHVAVTPASQSYTRIESAQWAIVPVKKTSGSIPPRNQSLRSTIHFPSNAASLQSFARIWHKTVANSSRASLASTFDVKVLDAVPIALDTVFVGVDFDALEATEKPRKSLSSPTGLRSIANGALRNAEGVDEAFKEKWQVLIKQALQKHAVLHVGDLLQLPQPLGRRSRSALPPIVIELCQPVSQGTLVPETKVVLLSTGSKVQALVAKQSYTIKEGIAEEEGEETSNEQYHTAVEDPGSSPAPKKAGKHEAVESSTSSESLTSENDDSSDDLSDGEGPAETIGLSLPILPVQNTGPMSAFGSATPRLGGSLLGINNGIASPGSVLSGYTMSTVLGGGFRGKLFQATGLSSRVPNDVLHPKPSNEEDEEARVFVDTTSLQRLGCFSGDWVRIEAAPDEHLSTLGSWGLGAFENEDEGTDSRCVRIYALPGQAGARQRYALDKKGRTHYGQHVPAFRRAPLKAYLSPVLLANLGSPPNVRVAPLAPSQGRRVSRTGPQPQADRITNISTPPVARDVTLRKFSTPSGHERRLDSSIKWALGDYFTKKHRAVKAGDLIAIPIPETLGRALNQGNVGDEDSSQKELMAFAGPSSADIGGKTVIAWFKVGAVHSDDEAPDSPWEGMAIVRSDITKVSQAGDEYGKLPDAIKSTWQYYLGVKRLPATTEDASPYFLESQPKPYISLVRRRLRELISVATSPQAVHLSLPPVAVLLVSSQRHVGKATLVANACADLGLHNFVVDAFDVLSEGGAGGGDVKTAGLLEARAELGLVSGPEQTVLLLKHVEILTADRMTATLETIIQKSRVFIATTSNVDKVAEGMRSLFTHEIEISAPDEGEREGLLRDIVQESGKLLAPDVDLAGVAVKTAALVAGDLVDVVDRASVERQSRLETLAKSSKLLQGDTQLDASVRDIQIAGGDASRAIIKADFDAAVDAARKNFADAIGAPKIPNVTWDDVGGLSNVKDAVMETIQLPLERPELFAKGMKKRSGILFYGPPGTGKTLLAKAIATEFSLNFFSVKGPELLNMYIGESEANVRRVFQRARDARPCVVFFDELDSVAPKRGNQGDSGGVMDRIVSQLLAELDGMSSGEDGGGGVFVIGATNRPDLLDQALLRPGRFDKMLYLGISDTHQKQLTILQALTRKFTLSPSLSLEVVADRLPFTYTGADLYALCSDAMLKAITRKSNAVDAAVRAHNAARTTTQEKQHQPPITVAYYFDHLAGPQDTAVVVEQSDFEAAQAELVPSVSLGELEHYERVRHTFESNEGSNKKPQPNGRKANGNSHSQGEDDLVQGTQRLALEDGDVHSNGMAATLNRASGRGKGKGKASTAEPDGFGDAAAGDEDLYG